MAGVLYYSVRCLRPSMKLAVVSGFGNTQMKCRNLKKMHHTTTTKSSSWRMGNDSIEISYGDMSMHFTYVWLRDNCRSPICYNFKTNQRILDTATIDLKLHPADTRIDDGHLFLTWPDGHVTEYSLSWLAENSSEGRRRTVSQPRVLWNNDIYQSSQAQSAKWEKFMSCEDERKAFLRNFLLYGVAFVEDVPATVEATEAVTKRVSLIRETMFGRMWSFTSDLSRGDTAYTSQALDRHTDTSYFQEPCGIQVFHCLRHEGGGGRTLLVDGFYSAEELRRHSPGSFQLLSRIPIRHEYVEATAGHRNHMVGVGPVLDVYPWNDEVYMIRYNNYDRAPIDTVPHDVVQRWYEAHRELTAELRRPENELWVKLTPGKVVFIDNWRVMHGRESFTGLREVCGCYLTRDDVLSAARTLGLKA